MKKILISILIILLLILSYFVLAKGISFLKIKSINNIKQARFQLESSFNLSKELSNKTHPIEVEGLEEAIKKLKIAKQDYENKKAFGAQQNSITTIEIKSYKIHYLWTRLGNYRKDRKVESLALDLKTTPNKDVYDLEFTLIGEYTNITDFLYEIENDEELNFQITNFNMQPYKLKTTNVILNGEDPNNKHNTKITQEENPYNTITEITTSTTTDETGKYKENAVSSTDIYDPKWVETTFTVKSIGITLD